MCFRGFDPRKSLFAAVVVSPAIMEADSRGLDINKSIHTLTDLHRQERQRGRRRRRHVRRSDCYCLTNLNGALPSWFWCRGHFCGGDSLFLCVARRSTHQPSRWKSSPMADTTCFISSLMAQRNLSKWLFSPGLPALGSISSPPDVSAFDFVCLSFWFSSPQRSFSPALFQSFPPYPVAFSL